MIDALLNIRGVNTSISDYVWLPIRFDGDMAYLDWHDESHVEGYCYSSMA